MKISAIQNYSFIKPINKTNPTNSIASISNTNIDKFERQNKSYNSAISFKGVHKGAVLQRAVLMPITFLAATGSLCGQFLDPESNIFQKFLKDARQTHWIVNPLHETSKDLCPYNPLGRFSINKYIVNINELCTKKYGNIMSKGSWQNTITGDTFTLRELKAHKDPLFIEAYKNFLKLEKNHPLKIEFNEFCNINNRDWLDDYAVYNAMCKKHSKNVAEKNNWEKSLKIPDIESTSWYDWDRKWQTAPEDAKEIGIPLKAHAYNLMYPENSKKDITEYNFNIGLYKFEQFLANKQLMESVKSLKKDKLRYMTDFPIGVASDGMDVWLNKDMFLLDKKTLRPKVVSGCPSQKDGKPFTQVWGHALGDFHNPKYWDYLEKSLKQLLSYSDVRLDHFAAYVNRAEIPAKWKNKDGVMLEGLEIFEESPKGMGTGFFKKRWIKNVGKITDPREAYKGQTVFDMLIRLAGKRGSQNAYMIESLGKLTETKAYRELFDEKYGQHFTHQRTPMSKGIENVEVFDEILNKPELSFAVSTGNHDKSTLRTVLLGYLKTEDNKKKSAFESFCKNLVGIAVDAATNLTDLTFAVMEWFYKTFGDNHIHTTIMDILALEGRYNIPGSTLTSINRYFRKENMESTLPFWSSVMDHGFLIRKDKCGVDSGYAKEKDRYIEMQERLHKETNV